MPAGPCAAVANDELVADLRRLDQRHEQLITPAAVQLQIGTGLVPALPPLVNHTLARSKKALA
jgi:hypothetical protein